MLEKTEQRTSFQKGLRGEFEEAKRGNWKRKKSRRGPEFFISEEKEGKLNH